MNIHGLLSILEDEYRIYQTLHDLALKKKEVLIEGKVNELDEIVRTEQACIAAVSKLEDEREEWLKEHEMTGMEDIHEVLENNSDEEKRQLSDFQERFKKLLQEVADVNEHNQALIEQALEYIEFSINLIGDALTSDNTTYEKRGTDQKSSALFDEKI